MSLYYLANAIYTKADIIIQIIKTFVRFLMAYTTPWNTHVHIWRRHRTHTHAGRHEIAVNLVSAFSHPGLSRITHCMYMSGIAHCMYMSGITHSMYIITDNTLYVYVKDNTL